MLWNILTTNHSSLNLPRTPFQKKLSYVFNPFSPTSVDGKLIIQVCAYTCRLESIIFKLEVLDHKARERAGVITPTLASPIPVLLQHDVASEVMCLFFAFSR